jgi:hypothetical protein
VNIPVVDTAPVEIPEQPPIMKLLDDGVNRRLYIFYDEAWSYINLVGGGSAPTEDYFSIITVSGEDDVVGSSGRTGGYTNSGRGQGHQDRY